ncbi:ABC transporter ATP-binding protein [Nitrospina watsonii]|uniref:Lipoprotein-releasing system ATP-binding protein LolD n=1 Tax=Nitrospina watsonii TaxID=1323948 RepID=A0ABM9HEC4_9BACT|nr:ABC transporter ATP-binding protein [Nitrospina watsonii]CAI2718527.1 Lipoprotein-releasing system ATP-binding protein LolD [Nitrospina watsonii]
MFSMENVTKVYRVGEQDFTALHSISLEIESGSFLSFVGPSGSGKTTLLNILGGLDRPTTGEVRFQGKSLSVMSRVELAAFRRDHVGFIFQSYNLLPVYDVYENVLFPLILMGRREADVRDRVRELVHEVGLSDQIHKKPATLSGGQCQRVAIARALVKNPAVVLADEPTANLDAENSYHILELMQKLNRDFNAAFVFSTHDEKVTQFVRREIQLEDGYVKADRTRKVGGEAA